MSAAGPADLQGATLPYEGDRMQAVKDLLEKLVSQELLEGAVLPHPTPVGDSFAYVLCRASDRLREGEPLPPILPVQGARALATLKRERRDGSRVAAFMRPCEVRGVIELAKLNQVDRDGLILISTDCPGALPLDDWFADPEPARDRFSSGLDPFDEALRPLCRVCDRFAFTAADLHVGWLGLPEGELMLLPGTPAGQELLEALGLEPRQAPDAWREAVLELHARRADRREQELSAWRQELTGIEGLSAALARCVGCRICRDVCPICICRECYFDAVHARPSSDEILERTREVGSLRFPMDRVLFHLGRMAHMSLQCVSCGTCEDACPARVPVGRLFAMVGRDTAALFEYQPGLEPEAEIPLATYREHELEAWEDGPPEGS